MDFFRVESHSLKFLFEIASIFCCHFKGRHLGTNRKRMLSLVSDLIFLASFVAERSFYFFSKNSLTVFFIFKNFVSFAVLRIQQRGKFETKERKRERERKREKANKYKKEKKEIRELKQERERKGEREGERFHHQSR